MSCGGLTLLRRSMGSDPRTVAEFVGESSGRFFTFYECGLDKETVQDGGMGRSCGSFPACSSH